MEPAHWTRIKALSRRFATGSDEYDTLRPVADLKQQLSQLRVDFKVPDPMPKEAYGGLYKAELGGGKKKK